MKFKAGDVVKDKYDDYGIVFYKNGSLCVQWWTMGSGELLTLADISSDDYIRKYNDSVLEGLDITGNIYTVLDKL